MAHAAPAPSRMSGTRIGSAAKLAPVLAVVYGIWAAGINRHAGPITGMNVLFGIVTGVALGVLYLAVLRLAPRLPRELRAFAWAALAGGAFGFLYSLTGVSILRSAGHAALVAGAVACAVFYRFYTSED
ncbi:hypothetical protein [Streptomyces sp. NBC_01304]|uniref:hypothetical protein n=1 Tax=Streptomyces sp. NBC_01304 TaxID=2903818 RepID=UPI002E0D68F7|nr:hypothetical protein OG430_24385 [Streptomyces sp. NBC_01304]